MRLDHWIGALLLTATPALAQDVTLKLHHFLPETSFVPAEILTPWAERIEAESGGRIKVEAYPSMALGGKPADLIEQGFASWESGATDARLIVRGRANLIETEAADLDRIRVLFDDLERKRDIAQFLDLTEGGDGVRIFIGSENKLFSLSGSSLVVSPYMNSDRKIIGAVGVIGPTRLNYGRIVPIVDYTAQLVGRALSGLKG